MDATDLRLLRTLLREPRASFERLGQATGLSPNAAKARYARLRDDGLLRGVLAAPDAATLGLREGLLVFRDIDDPQGREDDLLHNLSELTGVRFADVGIDGTVLLWLYVRDEADAERIERAAISLVGRPPEWRRLASPREARPLRPQDWRAARELLQDARTPASDAAARAGVSARTFRRRIDALVADGRLRLSTVLSTAESATPLVEVVLVPTPEATPAGLADHAPEGALVAPGLAGTMHVFVPGRNLREARQKAARLRDAPGVERVLPHVSTRRAGTAWIDEISLRAIAPAAPTPTLAPVPKSR